MKEKTQQRKTFGKKNVADFAQDIVSAGKTSKRSKQLLINILNKKGSAFVKKVMDKAEKIIDSNSNVIAEIESFCSTSEKKAK